MTTKYRVRTWDMDLQEWTPQKGVRQGPYSLWGLRKALRKLQDLGYPCGRDDNFVLVEKIDNFVGPTIGERGPLEPLE